MKVQLLRDARIRHKAGETVEVSPAEAGFLFSTRSAVRVFDAPDPEVRETLTAEEPGATAEEPEEKTTEKKTAVKKPARKKTT